MNPLASLAEIVGTRYVTDGDELRDRPQDFWNRGPTCALALVRPGSVEEVSAVLAWCNRHSCPVVPEGGRTNMVQGTAAGPDAILLSAERLNRLNDPDPGAMSVQADAGVVIQTLQDRCGAAGLRFGLDFGARGSAMLGGALSTNAGGFQALRYGVARDQVLGLEAVLADGTVLSHLSPYAKDNTGYDLKQLFIGSEGTLGVITCAVLRLHPAPMSVNTALLAFDSFEAVIRTLARMRRDLQGTLSGFEIMWEEFFEFNLAALTPGRRPLAGGHPFYILCEAEGFASDTDATRFEQIILQALDSGDVANAVIAQSARQRDELWRLREDFEAEQELFTVMIDFDVSLPLRVMDAFAGEVRQVLASQVPERLGLHILGHLGDGNLHVTTGLPSHEGAAVVKAVVYDLIAKYGGSVSAEHGIGLNKRDYLGHSRSDAEIATMQLLKRTLDPNRILNPGKILL